MSTTRIGRPQREAGFTLIELLVVIVILGVLSSVVVFAVRGSGDKGQAASVDIDERTLRTAQEGYCGQNGRYGSGQELVDGKFLSDKPQYHNVYARQDGGTCNGWSFSILRTAQAGPYASGSWAATAPAPGVVNLQRLPDGRVLSIHGVAGPPLSWRGAIWDPGTGLWTVLDDLLTISSFTVSLRGHPVVLRDDPSTPASECGANCGKVMVRASNCGDPSDLTCQPFYLFNPSGLPGARWEQLRSNEPAMRSAFNLGVLVQLHDDPSTPGNQCGANCGKVLITSPDRPTAELYDPKKANDDPTAFIAITSTDATFPFNRGASEPTPLPDGRLLLLGGTSGGGARLLTPDTLQIIPAAQPAYSHDSPSWVRFPTLPSGEILTTSYSDRRVEIYTPEPGGPGSWRTVANGCPNAGLSPRCQIFASLPDGRVLAYSTTGTGRRGVAGTGRAWIFNPATERWVQTADVLDRNSVEGVLLDARGGPCGIYCGKVLVAGSGSFPNATALYTP